MTNDHLGKFSVQDVAALARAGIINSDEATAAIKGKSLGPEELHNLVISGAISVNQARKAMGLDLLP